MYKLEDIVDSSKSLSDGLKDNAKRHRNYKTYTSIERAMSVLRSKKLYISNGKTWNDKRDKDSFRKKNYYGKSFSFSTRENVAMWMLYGDKLGKNGAMLNVSGHVMNEVINTPVIEIGKFDNDEFKVKHTLYKEKGEFEVFLTDVVYIDTKAMEAEEKKDIQLNLYEEHVHVDKAFLDDEDVFYKDYAWAYERECRLVIKLLKNRKLAEDKECDTASIPLSDKSILEMKNNNPVRSPIYTGKIDEGVMSDLTGSVEWDL